MFIPSIELNFELLMEKKSRKNENECVKAAMYIVILEYSLYSKLHALFYSFYTIFRVPAKTYFVIVFSLE